MRSKLLFFGVIAVTAAGCKEAICPGDSRLVDGQCVSTALCGDGVTNGDEECDDSGANTSQCNRDCTLPSCGDGLLNAEAGEACDEGTESPTCHSDCRIVAASDGNGSAPLVAGNYHTCALLNDGNVKCWGGNSEGQLGLGDTENRGDSPEEMGSRLPTVDLGPGRTAVLLVAGGLHTCALLDNGALKCWGDNEFGQLGLGDTNDRGNGANEMGAMLPAVDLGPGRAVSALAAGDAYTCALFDDSAVKCWGRNHTGRLGLGDLEHRGDEPGEMGTALPTLDLGPDLVAQSLSAAAFHTCAIVDAGALKCWGGGLLGKLGIGDNGDRGASPGSMGAALPFVDLGPGRSTIALGAGGLHTCALLNGGEVKCWGRNTDGELGLGDTEHRGGSPGDMGSALPIVDLGPQRRADAIAAGASHTCALLTDGAIKCWGNNAAGRLGLGDTANRGDEPGEMGTELPFVDLGAGSNVRVLVAGAAHTCALLDNGAIKCWGDNSFGQLGLGDMNNRGDTTGEVASISGVRL